MEFHFCSAWPNSASSVVCILARTTQWNKGETQFIIILKHESHSVCKKFEELESFSKTCDETSSHEDRPRKGRPVSSSASKIIN